MNYQIKAYSTSNNDAIAKIKQSKIDFGTTTNSSEILPNPAEIFLSSFAACILKNVERFSTMMNFTYTNANVVVHGVRLEHPPRMDKISYDLKIHSNDKRLNTALLKKNIEKHGTIYNTVKLSCSVSGKIIKIEDV
jgi:uncharacterized OsmC-like protein